MDLSQKKLDLRTKQFRKAIDEANAAADMFCTAGDAEASGGWRKVAGLITMAYAEARLIAPKDALAPSPKFGGDGK